MRSQGVWIRSEGEEKKFEINSCIGRKSFFSCYIYLVTTCWLASKRFTSSSHLLANEFDPNPVAIIVFSSSISICFLFTSWQGQNGDRSILCVKWYTCHPPNTLTKTYVYWLAFYSLLYNNFFFFYYSLLLRNLEVLTVNKRSAESFKFFDRQSPHSWLSLANR